ncbi:MAG: lipopolysaccharide heptosyltransferase II [candidate division Zixibacteria bacterium RBG_16_40_9]|nr:MAG: lipopolysaccharide heptosyltransferase II [candidate division Zixibacteria bacterium RBG_16_40_9]
MRILVVRFSSLGDLVLTSSPLKSLHQAHPQAQIFLLTKSKYQKLAECLPFVTQVISIDPEKSHKGLKGFFRLIKELKSYNFDVIVDLHSNWRSFLIRKFLAAPQKIKYDKRSLARFLMVHWKVLKIKPQHTLELYNSALRKLGDGSRILPPQLILQPADLNWASDYLKERKVFPGDFLVGLSPGAKWETKRWDKEKFVEVGEILAEKVNAKIIIFGDEKESELVNYIAQNLNGQNPVCALDLKLNQLVALIDQCKLFISNDSGLMHIATARSVPTVTIFGPTHPKLGFTPFGEKSIALTANVKCSPCSLHGKTPCYQKSRFCMDFISPQQVVEESLKILSTVVSLAK